MNLACEQWAAKKYWILFGLWSISKNSFALRAIFHVIFMNGVNERKWYWILSGSRGKNQFIDQLKRHIIEFICINWLVIWILRNISEKNIRNARTQAWIYFLLQQPPQWIKKKASRKTCTVSFFLKYINHCLVSNINWCAVCRFKASKCVEVLVLAFVYMCTIIFLLYLSLCWTWTNKYHHQTTTEIHSKEK